MLGFALVAGFLLPPSPRLRGVQLPRCRLSCCAEPSQQAQQSFFKQARAASGEEAFANTKWSMMMTVNTEQSRGTVLFSTHLLDDERARFSDTDKLGEWQCEQDFVVVEKPDGLYNSTLYLSARLQLPTPEQPRLRLVEGIVQQSFPVEGSDEDVELRQIGTFGGHEQIEDVGMGGFGNSDDV